MTMPMTPEPAGRAPARRALGGVLPARVKPALLTVGSFGLLLVLVQIVNSLLSYRLNAHYGLVSRSLHGLIGVLAAPLLHANWAHLFSNLVPLLIFGVLIMLGNVRQFIAVTALVWLVSGLGVWVFGPSNVVTIGASGLVFGWLAYLVTRGIFTRNLGQIAVGVVLLVMWGGVFWTGILKLAVQDITSVVTISWQGHLFGAIGGVLAAFLAARADGPRRKQPTTSSLILPR